MSQHDEISRLPPQSRAAEQSVLGSMLRLNSVIDDVARLVRKDDFYADAHQKVYDAIIAIHGTGKPADLITLAEELRVRGHVGDVGGYGYLGELYEASPTAAHASHHADIVRQKALVRSLIQTSTEILRDCYDEIGPGDELLEAAERNIMAIRDRRRTSGPVPLSTLIEESLAEMDRRIDGSGVAGLSTGMQKLDQVLGGLRPEEVIVIGALTSVGKSSLAFQLASTVAANVIGEGKAVFIASLEMSELEVANRILCAAARVELSRFRNGKSLTDDDLEKISIASVRIRPWLLEVDGSPSQSMVDIGASARQMKRKHGLGMVVIDYIQLVEPEPGKGTRTEAVDDISRRVKILAKELKVPVVVLAQLSKEAEKTKPRVGHLRESGRIGQDADVVMLLSKLNESGDEVNIEVAKQRNGPCEDIPVRFRKEFGIFEDLYQSPFGG